MYVTKGHLQGRGGFCKLHTTTSKREFDGGKRWKHSVCSSFHHLCVCELKGCLYYVHMKICLISLRTECERVWVGMFSMTWWCWMGGGEETVSLCLFECFCVVALCTGSSVLHPAQLRVVCGASPVIGYSALSSTAETSCTQRNR